MGLRLNLGCGLVAPAGWVNIDRSPSLLVRRVPGLTRALRAAGFLADAQTATWPANVVHMDVTKGLPYPADSVEAIYSSHMLEHLYLDDAVELLKECHRVLIRGGVLRLALPDIDHSIERFLEAGSSAEASIRLLQDLNAHPLVRPSKRRALIAGRGSVSHLWFPMRGLVRSLLLRAGFEEIEERSHLEGRLPDIASIENRPDSLFIEAAR